MRRIHDSPYVSDGLHVYVDDADAHYAKARAAGAPILTDLEETPFGDRHYRVEDLEGLAGCSPNNIRDVTPEEWGATT